MKGPCIDLFFLPWHRFYFCDGVPGLGFSLSLTFWQQMRTHLASLLFSKPWWSNLINLIPDQLRWWMVTVLISDWPCCSCTSHLGFMCKFLHYIAFRYFRPSSFKTIVFVNHHKSNHHKLRATCI